VTEVFVGEELDADLLIIGAGPVGLYAAYYAGFRGQSVIVLDSLPELGGQVSALYPEKRIYDVAGLPAIRGRDLVANLVTQAAQFQPRYLVGAQAVGLEYTDDGRPVVTTADGARVTTRAVVISGGVGSFRPRRLPSGERWAGRGVDYFVRAPAQYADKDVVIVGGGDSAFDWAQTLEPIARSVSLVHRRSTFRAHAATVRQVLASTVDVLTETEVVGMGGGEALEFVEVRDNLSGEVSIRKADAVIGALGFIASLGPLAGWGLDLAGRNIAVDSTMATNLEHIYAAGDITDYRGKVRLISVGFGEAATAVNNAIVRYDPTASLFPGHSTDAA
jgi:thioredoxin reductase